MAPSAGARKRNRKRKRRAVSSSESSSDSGSSSSSSNGSPAKAKWAAVTTAPVQNSSDSEDTSSSESNSDSDSGPTTTSRAPPVVSEQASKNITTSRHSLSPSPPPANIPSFVTPNSTKHGVQAEQVLKGRFRKFWMASVADGFKDDLEQIRKEPNFGTSRLALLIDSLASGADVFSSHSGQSSDINEMEVVLDPRS